MTILPYSTSHTECIIYLLRLNTPKYFAPEEEADLKDYLDNHIDHYYIVEDDGKIIGCGGFNLTEDKTEAMISWDIIHTDYHCMGVGSALTKFRIDKIMQIKGVNKISVRTSQLVYKFYEKFGFGLKEAIKDYWANGFDMYRMERDISKA